MRNGKKKIANGELTLDATSPKPSPHVKADPDMMTCWKEVIGLLKDQGNLIKTDALAIELAATVLATYRKIDAELKTLPSLTIVNSRGELRSHPLVGEKATYATKLSKALNDLRLTPVTRSKAVAGDEDLSMWYEKT